MCPGEESANRARSDRVGRHIAVSVLILLLPSCGGKSLPTAPSEVTSGLTIFEDANYIGESALVTSSIANLADFKGPCLHVDSSQYSTTTTLDWNDCISSIRIAPGWRATVYRDTGYRGESLDVSADLPNLQLVPGRCDHDGMNDCISSIRLSRF